MRDAGTRSLQLPGFLENAQQASPLEEGRQVGRYQLLLPIARGGMAEVWVARLLGELGFSRLFALKTIRSEFAADTSFRERFFEEARIAARLRHTNIVEVIDLGEEGSILFQVMTLIEGASVADLVRARPQHSFPPPIAARILCDTLSGLHAAHELRDDHEYPLQLVHRDVSPHNILVGLDGVSKLTDFGVAKVLGGLPDDLLFGEVRGKPGYRAPEQIESSALDRRADIFAAGVVLWELLTGRKLFTDELRPVPDPRELSGEVSAELAQVVLRALAPDPEARYATAAELNHALEAVVRPASANDVGRIVEELCGDRILEMRESIREIVSGESKTVIAPLVTPSPSPSPARRAAKRPPPRSMQRVVVLLASAIVIAVSGFVLVSALRTDPPPPPVREISEPTAAAAVPAEVAKTSTVVQTPAPVKRVPPNQVQKKKLKPEFANPYK